jgi:DNA-binding transcriptional MerR regulator
VIAEADTKPLTIGRLAQQAVINLETVRFYERQGLLLTSPVSKLN